MTQEEFLLHYGIKGMRWGVRKKRESTPKETRAVKTASGKDMTLVKKNASGLAKLLTKISPAVKSNVENSSFFDITDDTGKKVGSLHIFKESKDVLNVVWVDTKSSQKGKGYATAAMKETIKIAKEQGVKKVTLEVPAISPDALHIYKKLGFKETGTLSDKDDVWGGLTNMELELNHSYAGAALKHYSQVNAKKGDKPMTQGEFLLHYGVKGMRWGIRKKSYGPITPSKSDSPTTRRVKKDYNELDDAAFRKKYQTTKRTYAKRVAKYGDPYMNSPLAKMGKKLEASNAARLEKHNTKVIQKKDKKWEGEAGRKLMDKYGADAALRKEVFSKAAKILEKQKYATNADAQNLTTKLYVEAINKRLANDPGAKSPSGSKRLQIELVSVNGQSFMKPVVQEKTGKG